MASENLANMCLVCSKRVRHNQRTLYCNASQHWVHVCCTSYLVNEYDSILKSCDWYCHICISRVFPLNSLEDIEFMNCIFDIARSDTVRYDMIESVCQFNIIQIHISMNEDIDPDTNFY